MKSLQSQIIFSTAQQDLESASQKSPADACNDIAKSYRPSCKSTLRAYSFYHNNQIQIKLSWKAMSDNYVEPYTYVIKWKPIVCDSNETFSEGKAVVKGSNFIITGLQFACKYKVTVRPFTLQGPLVEEVTFVKTPKCNNMKVKSLKHGRCSRQGRHRLSRNVMHTPDRLSAAFYRVNGRIEGKFHWQFLQSEQSHTITAFLFRWAEISDTAQVYNTRTLPPDNTFTYIEDLKPSTSYHIAVQVISRNQNISSAEKTVLTPGVKETLRISIKAAEK
ncbi:anosmin-1-like [Pseudophryne corroboree]|uniref:anosmin-1-like n=1 Tax=Pseudophryne corroboree TaxID=495146 RepID=UPI0030821595